LAHVLIGEPVPTSPEHALLSKAAARRQPVAAGRPARISSGWRFVMNPTEYACHIADNPAPPHLEKIECACAR
jgi:hypothetical protein